MKVGRAFAEGVSFRAGSIQPAPEKIHSRHSGNSEVERVHQNFVAIVQGMWIGSAPVGGVRAEDQRFSNPLSLCARARWPRCSDRSAAENVGLTANQRPLSLSAALPARPTESRLIRGGSGEKVD